MRVTKTVRLASNPRKSGKRRTRKLSPKQIMHFGTKRQKAALKANRKRKRTVKNSARKTVAKRVSRRVKRSTNPLVLHLKPLQRSNPKRRGTTMAKPKRKRKMKNTRRRVARVSNRRRRASNPVRHRRRASNRRNPVQRRRRRSNPRRRNSTTRVVVMAPRRQNRRRGSRNPQLFGSSLGSKNSLMVLGGGLAGVAAAKFIPTLIPTSLTSGLGTSSFGPFIISGVSAIAAWWIASKVNVPFSEGVLFGGLMQTASVALNAFLPGFTIAGVPIALSGFGDLVAGRFVVPQNPLRQMNAPSHAMAPIGSKVTNSGLGRAYPSAY